MANETVSVLMSLNPKIHGCQSNPKCICLDSEIFDSHEDKLCSANNIMMRYSFMSLIALVQLVHLAFNNIGYESVVD